MCWLLYLVPAPDRDGRQTGPVFVVAAFHVFVSAAVAAVFVAVHMLAVVCLYVFLRKFHQIMTPLKAGRSPQLQPRQERTLLEEDRVPRTATRGNRTDVEVRARSKFTSATEIHAQHS